MLPTVCVLFTKKQLEKYIELLDFRINYLKMKKNIDTRELDLYISMRKHALASFEQFR
ncbi:MAG: hypothetical protein ACI4C4_11860 [Lachnospiraceae bacterium]